MSTKMETSEQKKLAVARWIEQIWDRDNLNSFDELATPGYTWFGPGVGPLHGRAELQAFLVRFRVAFPDHYNTIEEQVVEGNTVVTRGITRGHHLGQWNDLPPSGNLIQVPWIMITRFANGKIIEDWEMYDSLAFMQQIGAAKLMSVAVTA